MEIRKIILTKMQDRQVKKKNRTLFHVTANDSSVKHSFVDTKGDKSLMLTSLKDFIKQNAEIDGLLVVSKRIVMTSRILMQAKSSKDDIRSTFVPSQIIHMNKTASLNIKTDSSHDFISSNIMKEKYAS